MLQEIKQLHQRSLYGPSGSMIPTLADRTLMWQKVARGKISIISLSLFRYLVQELRYMTDGYIFIITSHHTVGPGVLIALEVQSLYNAEACRAGVGNPSH